MGVGVGAVRVRRPMVKRAAIWAAPALVVANLLAMVTAGVAQAGGSADAVTVQVHGGTLGDISSSPLSLTPAFAPTITDYVLRCQSGTNTIQLTLTAVRGGSINVGAKRGSSVTIQRTLVENQALVVSASRPQTSDGGGVDDVSDNSKRGRVQYWIRCLPHDFPQLSVTKAGTPPPGWYLTGNLFPVAGSGTYAMVLDGNGTPVWYRAAGPNVFNVTLLPDGTIAWGNQAGPGFGVDPAGAFEDFNFTTRVISFIAAAVPPTDFHELHPTSNGHLMMLSTPLRTGVDMSALGLSTTGTVVDCVVQEVDREGRAVWQWRASDHISVAESSVKPVAIQVGSVFAYDIFHCNSIDTDPASGNVLLSSRHTNAVYLINKVTGAIVWKMGGNAPNHDHAQILTIKGDPEGGFLAQHDARFRPGGDISLFDNHTWDAGFAARGVEYHIDTAAGTASLVWSYQSPDGQNSAATGTFRRMAGGNDNVIGWGIKKNALFTEVDAAGRVMMEVTFSRGDVAYRVIKVPAASLDRDLLRATAGLQLSARSLSSSPAGSRN
jgi:Arylsulfotransferase (ASST)